MSITEREQVIIAQTAVKGAVELVAHNPNFGESPIGEVAGEVFAAIIDLTDVELGATPSPPPVQQSAKPQPTAKGPFKAPKPQDGGQAKVASVLKKAFPGTTTESKTEELWKELFDNPDAWWDNRESKKTPTGPDFRVKDRERTGPKGYPLSLWISADDTPEWVLEALG